MTGVGAFSEKNNLEIFFLKRTFLLDMLLSVHREWENQHYFHALLAQIILMKVI